ncbi:MAG TPA: CinA family protein [Burkholderiaceae bacterium]|nr:CinA family protein [Burkholderiaceae bacterium]
MSAERIVQLAEELGRRLLDQRLVLATAESCTAGGIAYAVTTVAGSSQWFDRGFVTYSNDAKIQHLGVTPVYLRDFGAVSEPVARAMAMGALSHSAAQIAISTTGIAGPEGGTADKPVGTVCFGWAIRRDPSVAPWVQTATRRFEGNRAAIRTQSIIAALEETIELLRSRRDV